MIIREIKIDRFGKWKNVRFSNLEAGVNLFYGPNEAGKTTLKQFVRYILFGDSHEMDGYFTPEDSKRYGGEISVHNFSRDFSLARPGVASQKSKGELKITDASGNRLDNRLMNDLLSNDHSNYFSENRADNNERIAADAELYLSVFAIGLHELQAISTLSSPQLSSLLYDLSTGLQRNSLQNLLAALQNQRAMLLKPEDSTAVLESEEFLRLLDQKSNLSAWRNLYTEMPPQAVGVSANTGLILRQMMLREILMRQTDDAKTYMEDFAQLSHEHFSIANEREKAEEISEQISHQLQVLRLAQEIRLLWQKREELDKQIVDFRNSSAFSVGDGERFDAKTASHEFGTKTTALANRLNSVGMALANAEKQKSHAGELHENEKRYRRRLKKLTDDSRTVQFFPEMLGLLPRMEAILMHEERVQGLSSRISALKKSRAETLAELEISYQRLAMSRPNFNDTSSEEEMRRLEKTGDLSALRIPARDIRRLIHKIRNVKKTKNDQISTQKNLARQLGAYHHGVQERICAVTPDMAEFFSRKRAAEPHDFSFIDVLSAKLGQKTAHFRRQIAYFDKVKQLCEAEPSSRRLWSESRERLVTPVNELLISGMLFTLGLALAIYAFTAFFMTTWPGHFLYFLLFLAGNSGWISVLLWKWKKEQRIQTEFRGNAAAMENLGAEIMSSVQSTPVLAAVLPDELENLEWTCVSDADRKSLLKSTIAICDTESANKLIIADVYQKELVLLEEQSLAAAKYRALREEEAYSRKMLYKYNSQLQAARNSYAETLAEIGLPGEWKPINVRNYRRNTPRLLELWRRLQRDEEDLARYETEFQVFSQKMQEILDEISKITAESAFATASFPEIREKMHEQLQAREEKARLRAEIKKVRKSLGKIRTARLKRSRRRLAILRQFGAQDESELRDKQRDLEELHRLYEQRGEIQRDIDTKIDFLCDENAIWEVYEKYTPPQLASRIQLMQQRLELARDDANAKNERLTEISARLGEMEQDRSIPELNFELAKVEQDILSAIRRWRTLALTHRLIETIKKTYEQKRQPETLNSASEFLCRLTGGKYVRVWTPVDEDILRVDREDGKVFSIEQLSTGTCEALFLALRLALIQGFRRQNLCLPAFFDDILVNFDQKRLHLAVEVLCEFFRPDERTPEGQQPQLFVFTCHEHIKEIFVQHGVNLCEMGQ